MHGIGVTIDYVQVVLFRERQDPSLGREFTCLVQVYWPI